jgi:DNA-binding response OmpR family regulator
MAGRILIIDDSETVLSLLGDALREAGFVVFCESNVIQAGRIVHQESPDLILLDVQMPMVSGGEVCRILKSREETARVPILFCSDLEESELEALTAEAGADGFVRKTRPMPELIAEIKKRLS